MKITLKAARINAGLNQQKVCDVLDITKQTLINYEKGLTYPRLDRLNKMATIYGVSLDNLDLSVKPKRK